MRSESVLLAAKERLYEVAPLAAARSRDLTRLSARSMALDSESALNAYTREVVHALPLFGEVHELVSLIVGSAAPRPAFNVGGVLQYLAVEADRLNIGIEWDRMAPDWRCAPNLDGVPVVVLGAGNPRMFNDVCNNP